MADHISYAETRKYLVAALKDEFPGVDFRVNKHNSSVTVRWTDGPASADVKRVTDQFEGESFDGMQDLAEVRYSRHPETGREVVWGTHYVNEQRDYSRGFLERIAAYVEQTYAGCKPLTIEDGNDWRGCEFAQDWENRPTGQQTGDTFPDIARRLAHETSVEALPLLELERTGIKPDKEKADKLRKLADGMQKAINEKMADRLANTSKRQEEAASQWEKGRQLMKVQAALNALADEWEAGYLQPILVGLDSKSQVEYLVLRNMPPTGKHEIKNRKSLRRAGIDCDHYYRARQMLLDMIPDGTGEKTAKDQLREIEQAVCLKPIAGFFPTPSAVIAQLLFHADIEADMLVLEPSAGRGDIADAILAAYLNEYGGAAVQVDCVEINPTLREILTFKNHTLVGIDFMQKEVLPIYDRVVMNPPFENGQDMQHVRRAYEFLRPGGRLVAVVSRGVQNGNSAAEEFRSWAVQIGGFINDLVDDAFKASDRPTSVRTSVVVIDKPEPAEQPCKMCGKTLRPADKKLYTGDGDVVCDECKDKPAYIITPEQIVAAATEVVELAPEVGDQPTPDETIFADWLILVNNALESSAGLAIDDLPDKRWRDWFDAGMTPQQAADQALASEGHDQEHDFTPARPTPVIDIPEPEDAGIDAMEAAADKAPVRGPVTEQLPAESPQPAQTCIVIGQPQNKFIYVPLGDGQDRSYSVREVKAFLAHLPEIEAFVATYGQMG